MPHDNQILEVIFEVVEQMNSSLPQEQWIEKRPEAALFGEDARLDSLGLVHFVVMTESRLRQRLQVDLSLTDDRALSQRHSPFRTIASLAAYVSDLLEEGDGREAPAPGGAERGVQ